MARSQWGSQAAGNGRHLSRIECKKTDIKYKLKSNNQLN
jgi:hypothetical protein